MQTICIVHVTPSRSSTKCPICENTCRIMKIEWQCVAEISQNSQPSHSPIWASGLCVCTASCSRDTCFVHSQLWVMNAKSCMSTCWAMNWRMKANQCNLAKLARAFLCAIDCGKFFDGLKLARCTHTHTHHITWSMAFYNVRGWQVFELFQGMKCGAMSRLTRCGNSDDGYKVCFKIACRDYTLRMTKPLRRKISRVSETGA